MIDTSYTSTTCKKKMKKINAVSMNLQLERQRNDRGKRQAHFQLQMHCDFHVCLQVFLSPELNLVIIFFMNTAEKSYSAVQTLQYTILCLLLQGGLPSLHCLVSRYLLLFQSEAVVKLRVAHEACFINARHIGAVKPPLQYPNPQSWFHKFLIIGCTRAVPVHVIINMLPGLILVSYWKSQIIE